MIVRKKRSRSKKQPAFAMAWYKREQWERLIEVSADRDDFDGTYKEWREGAELRVGELRLRGFDVTKVTIDVEELVAWCDRRNINVNGQSRSYYAAEKLREERKRSR